MMEHIFDIQKLNAWFADICVKSNMVFWISAFYHRKQLYVSPNYEALWGWSTTQLYEHPSSWSNTLLPEDYLALSQPFALRKNGHENTIYYRVRRPNGDLVYICDKSFQLVDSMGKPIALAGIAQSLPFDMWFAGKSQPLFFEELSLITSLEEVIKRSLGLLQPQFTRPIQDTYTIMHGHRCYSISLREAQCLCYSSQGYSAKEIAKQLNISPRTVETYLENLRHKTGSRNKLQLLGQIEANDLNLLCKQLL